MLSERKQGSLTELKDLLANVTDSLWGIPLSGHHVPTEQNTEPDGNIKMLINFLGSIAGSVWRVTFSRQNVVVGENVGVDGNGALGANGNAAVRENGNAVAGANADGELQERLDTLLLKFLEFNNFKVVKTIKMLNKVLMWRKEFKIDTLSTEGFDDIISIFGEFNFLNETDMHNQPVIYVKYGAIKDIGGKAREIMNNKPERLVRWRIQNFERAIEMLDFRNGGVHSLIEITDLKGIPVIGLERHIKEYELLMARYYPGFIGQRIYIHSEWYTYAKALLSYPLLIKSDQICKNIIFSRSHPTDILCKFIPPHHVPVEYGGMCPRKENREGIHGKPSRMATIKAYQSIELRVSIPAGIIASWEFLVIRGGVDYGVQFEPVEGLPLTVTKTQHIAYSITEVIKEAFYCQTAGEIRINVDNSKSDRSKKVAWRFYYER